MSNWTLAEEMERLIRINSFIPIQPSLSVLEGPLVTSRGDGRNYIYSNFNPKYAQMAS